VRLTLQFLALVIRLAVATYPGFKATPIQHPNHRAMPQLIQSSSIWCHVTKHTNVRSVFRTPYTRTHSFTYRCKQTNRHRSIEDKL